MNSEFWKQVPPSEPYRVILSDVRDKLYNTRERSRHLLASGFSEIPDDAIFTDVEQVSTSEFRVILLFCQAKIYTFVTRLYVQHCKIIYWRSNFSKICITIAVSCIVYLTFISSSAVLGAS